MKRMFETDLPYTLTLRFGFSFWIPKNGNVDTYHYYPGKFITKTCKNN
jgi:hypothetical protein